MDTTITLWQLRNLMWSTKQKFKHFNMLYNNAIKEYHRNVLALKTIKDYVKNRDTEEVDRIYRMFAGDKRQYRIKLEFAQDEIRMYKNEMHKWRDISTKLERAYWSTYNNLNKVWHVTEDDQFGRWIKKYKDVCWISNRFIGGDTKLHLHITGYNTTGCHHQVMVSLLDPKFGVLTNEHIY
ncbi:MAG: hypothetical protein II670_04740 [Alphaproteobacteria bacterium]|nr:hypothetical protein [Alphaproteobacteria bacterium]